jgi:hypothetical protein
MGLFYAQAVDDELRGPPAEVSFNVCSRTLTDLTRG